MPIITDGFRPGFRGRQAPAQWGRRIHYLASEHGRDGVMLAGASEQELTVQEGIELLGGSEVKYHELIIAPSLAECEAIRARRPEAPRREAMEAGHRIAKGYAEGRPYLLAMHEQDGRFHFHLDVLGLKSPGALGRHGLIQRVWDEEFRTVASRIQDWEAHQRFLGLRTQLQEVQREQRVNEHQRREAIRNAPPHKKIEVAKPFERRAREFVEKRFLLEVSTLDARYQSRGTHGSPEHRVEKEKAEFRRKAALNRVERRGRDRRTGRDRNIRHQSGSRSGASTRTLGAVGRITRSSVDLALKELGVSTPTRKGVRISISLASESAQAAVKVALEAARASAVSSFHLARASTSLVTGVLAAPFTAGASLKLGLREAGQDLASSAQEAGLGLKHSVKAAAQGVGKITTTTAQSLIPIELRSIANILSGRPLVGIAHVLPEPLQRALQLAGLTPSSAILAAFRMAADLHTAARSPGNRPLEVER